MKTLTKRRVRLVTIWRDGCLIGEHIATDWVDELGLAVYRIRDMAAKNSEVRDGGHVYRAAYTGYMEAGVCYHDPDAPETPPGRVHRVKAKASRKPTLSDVSKAARKAGMSYGQYVGVVLEGHDHHCKAR